MSNIETKRAANRAAFPAVSQIADEFRDVFGGGVKVLGGKEGGKSFGVLRVPSPNCDSCTGHDGGEGCNRMDYVALGGERPDPARVFCGYRIALPLNSHPIEVYRKYGMGFNR